MDGKIDQLINTLKEIKEDKLTHEKEMGKLIEHFNKNNYNFRKNSEKIVSKLNEIQTDLSNAEQEKNNLINTLFDKVNNKKTNIKPLNQKYRKFAFRESFLTKLFESDNFRTIYNIFFAFLIILLGTHITSSYINDDNEIFNYKLFFELFSGYSIMMEYHIYQVILSTMVIYIINYCRIRNFNIRLITIIYSALTLGVFILFTVRIRHLPMSVICKIIYSTESTRIIFKSFAYFSEKVLKVSYKCYNENILKPQQENREDLGIVIKDDGINKIIFEFVKINPKKEILNYIFFLYAPTIIYRDVYPRIKKMNYQSIFFHFINLVFGLIFNFLIFELKLIPYFNDTTLSFLNKDNILQTLVDFIIISKLVLFTLFFTFSHSYLNLFAELLRFGDRKFYKGFWNSNTPVKFYNKIIYNMYEFFMYYISLLSTNYLGKQFTKCVRILLFSAYLEYLLICSLGYFYPIVTVLMLIAHLISYFMEPFKHEKLTLLCWILLSFGFGILVLISLTEYFVHHHPKFIDYKFTHLFTKSIFALFNTR